MASAVKPIVWCMVLLLLAGAGTADAKSVLDLSKEKRDDPPGQVKKDPPAEPLPGPAPAPLPTPTPTPSTTLVQAPVHAPAAPPAKETPSPAPEPAAPAPGVPVEDVAPPSEDSAADEPRSRVVSPKRATGPASDAELAPLPPLVRATGGPTPTHVRGATVPTPSAELTGLWWGLPLAGLLALGIVASSGRLLQARRLERKVPLAKAAAPTPILAAEAPAGTVDEMLRAAKDAVDSYHYQEAIAWFDRVLAQDAKLAVAHFCRGVCLMALGRDEECYWAYRRAYEADPQEGAYRLELARACGRTGRTAEAMDVLGALLQAMPELAADVADDPSFASLRDHPRFLVMVGLL